MHAVFAAVSSMLFVVESGSFVWHTCEAEGGDQGLLFPWRLVVEGGMTKDSLFSPVDLDHHLVWVAWWRWNVLPKWRNLKAKHTQRRKNFLSQQAKLAKPACFLSLHVHSFTSFTGLPPPAHLRCIVAADSLNLESVVIVIVIVMTVPIEASAG